MENDTITDPVIDAPAAAPTVDETLVARQLIVEELLVEEISIDGMCGVY